MRPSIFKAVTLGTGFAGGVPALVPAAPVPQRVVISKPAAMVVLLGDDPDGLTTGGDAFRFTSFFPATAVFVLAAGQALYAVRVGAGVALSVHYADADDLFSGPRVLGMNRASQVRSTTFAQITYGGGVSPYSIAKAPPDSMLRVLLRNNTPVPLAPVFLSTNPNDLTITGVGRNQYEMQSPPFVGGGGASSVFILAPGQELFAASSPLPIGPRTIAAQTSRGALYGDIYLVQ
jgi:hypothetical protein